MSNKGFIETAVIVAAGMGSRLQRPGAPPKPLLPVMGIPIIARVMKSAALAGIKRFLVVTGHQAEKLEMELPGLLPESCELKLIHNPRFTEPNGVSLKIAVEELNEPFALLMSDHIFSPVRLKKAIERFAKSDSSYLVVESRETFTGDINDATLAATSGENITAIGKDLTRYDAIDTGMFVLNTEILKTAFAKAGKSPGISDIIRVMTQARQLSALYLHDGFWQDIDTPEDVDLATKKILENPDR